jgi:class 3 adenylate cyclase
MNEEPHSLRVRPDSAAPPAAHGVAAAIKVGWAIAALLPLIGLGSLLLRSKLDPNLSNPRLHFILFLAVGAAAALLANSAAQAAERRGDARVLLLSLAFLSTGLFLMLHALGTEGILFDKEYAGFHVAIPIGLLLAAVFGTGSAFVDARPIFASTVIRHRRLLRASVVVLVVLWSIWTLAELPGLSSPESEGANGSALGGFAAAATVLFAVSSVRYLVVFRGRLELLPASVIACFVLLAEAMIGVATTGERSWHASWWEWHGLILLAFLVIVFAANREWRDERFRPLYLSRTREREAEISVLFSDLKGYTTFAESATPSQVAAMLAAYYEVAAPLISKKFGGELEKFLGDGIMATFNTRGDQPDHALRAAGAALALQRELTTLADRNPGWLRVRVGVNTGPATVRELGGSGYVAYAVIGDTVNTGSRLESAAPVGGVLIGATTWRSLPAETIADSVPPLDVKGKAQPVDAYLLHELPSRRRTLVAG